ncbi:MAG: zinc ribbon domain-containing protein [Candidatus Heimdallarchaeaceae archaeon]
MAFNWEPTFYLLGIIFITTALFAIIIGITAKKIDFSDRLFSLKDRKTLLPRRPVRDKALATFADFEETEGIKMKRKEKSRRAKKSLPSPRPSSSKRMRDVEPIKDEEYYEEMSDRATLAGREHAPKYDDEAEEVEMLKEEADEVEMLGEREESAKYLCPNCGTSLEQGVKFCANCGKSIQEVFEGFSRDLSIMIPKNMCLDEVFRLKITLIRDEQFDDRVVIEEITVDKESAEYFSMNVTKLGEKIIEATTRIHGLEKGALIVRPIAIGHVASLAPQQRIVYFHPELEEIVVEFYITPTKWSKDLDSTIKIEFEQNYRLLRTIDIPIKIYKRKMEAIFGINISKWQTIVLFVYSAFGTLSGLISFFWDSFVPWITNLFGVS